MSTSDATRYIEGNLGPVTEEVTALDLEVIGTLPPQLDGRYLRNGPNPIGAIDPTNHHWFTGEGMVHGIRLRDGKAEWYRNRWVRNDEVRSKLGEPPQPSPFGADRPVFSANTNVIGVGGRTFAIVEAGSPPVELTDELETVGPSDFGGTLPWGFSAHPKVDPATGRLHVANYYWGWGNAMQYVVVEPDATVSVAQQIPLLGPGSPMVHDVTITATRVVFYDLPVTFDLDLAMAGRQLPYRWNPEHGARLGVMPLDGGDVTWVDLPELCYVYHPLNAYDTADGGIVIDLVVHPKMFDTDLNGPDEGSPTLQRWTIDAALSRVSVDVIDSRGQEFPRVDERLVGREARYGYCVAVGQWTDHEGLIRHDLRTGESVTYDHGPGRSTMETVFIPSAPDAGETDGWLMSVVHDANVGRGELVLLDAADLTAPPVARVLLPARVPYGFHGNWVPTPV